MDGAEGYQFRLSSIASTVLWRKALRSNMKPATTMRPDVRRTPPRTEKAAAGDAAHGLPKIDHLGGLIASEDISTPSLRQAASRLQARFGMSFSTATVTAICAGLAIREVHQ